MPHLSIQWHITGKCQQNCVHCYLKNNSAKKELTTPQAMQFLKDFKKDCNKIHKNTKPVIALTGGDPLLRKDIFKIIRYMNKNGFIWRILGNPFLINEKIVKKLKRNKIYSYQMSLDGLEKTHDKFRKKGSFKDTLRALKILRKNKIKTIIMMSISKANAKEIIPLMRFIDGKTDAFSFSRVSPTGNGRQMEKQMFSPGEYHKLLNKVYLEQERLKKEGCKTYWDKKDHLFTLLLYEKGLFVPEKNKTVYGGCGMCIRHFSMFPDGTFYACSKMNLKAGKYPEDTIQNIFLGKQFNEIRQIEKMEKCGKCEIQNYCRGCPSIAHTLTGNYYSPDPQCWKVID